MEKRTLLIPALLDRHWPLLRWAFESERYHAAVLEEGAEELGLRHMHNDLCYPFVLISGQVLRALKSGRWDPAKTSVLISQTGDGCRGSCLIRLLRPVLDKEGFPEVPLLSLNTRGIEKSCALPVGPAMGLRAVAAAFWGDALLLMGNQTRPWEAEPGSVNACIARWEERLSKDLEANRNLTPGGILRRCREMAEDFQKIEKTEKDVQKIAVVGDIYCKYCRLGNWDLERYLEEQNCAAGINGLTWYALYYLDSHLDTGPAAMRYGGKVLAVLGGCLQDRFIEILREAGYTVLPPYRELKALAGNLNVTRCGLGGGWLLSAEAAAWVQLGWRKVLSGLPFGCLPGHIYGRSVYAALQRQLPGSLIVGVDYDASIREITVQSRIRMLIDCELE